VPAFERPAEASFKKREIGGSQKRGWHRHPSAFARNLTPKKEDDGLQFIVLLAVYRLAGR
jgi:hypothetical protein